MLKHSLAIVPDTPVTFVKGGSLRIRGQDPTAVRPVIHDMARRLSDAMNTGPGGISQTGTVRGKDEAALSLQRDQKIGWNGRFHREPGKDRSAFRTTRGLDRNP